MENVLIVDDDPFDSGLIRTSIKNARKDIKISVVNDSSRAIEAYNGLAPDLLLLDIQMPSPSGIEILTMLKNHPKRKSARIIVLSGSTSAVDRNRALSLGADDYKVKPLSLTAYNELAVELVGKDTPSAGQVVTRQSVRKQIEQWMHHLDFPLGQLSRPCLVELL